MRKVTISLIIAVFLAAVCTLGFGYKKVEEPVTVYRVYMDSKMIGTIKSKESLEKYINNNGNYYKKKFKVNEVFAPNGLKIVKYTTFNSKTDPVEKIYNKIKDKNPFTIKGYQITINKEENKKQTKTNIFVLKEKTFKNAVTTIIETFVGKDKYNNYKENNQDKITTTGEIIENVYVDENITIKETKIPVNKKIYTNSNDLSKDMLYGENAKAKTYTVNAGDTIEEVAFKNKVNPAELLLANDTLTSEKNLLYPGQQIKVLETNPKISVVEETYSVKDTKSSYKTEEKYDENALKGDEKVIQEGQDGLDRISQNEKKVNGTIVYVDPKGKQVIKEPTNKIIVKGNKYVPDVGSLTNWGWPTDSGWTMSSGYGYRSLWGRRELHTGLDIAGTGYGSKIYATNNGKVMIAEKHYSYGNYVVINHNNGYMSLYGHMSKIAAKVGQTVAKGDVIGYVGCTGSCTGPHVHYEIWKGQKYNHINPSIFYPGGYR
ncbi:MAG: M23 family metallopeptidase [Bacilli bacterium]|nr:M23 family metallopeptidase [Bacilli bacterium]